MAEKGNFCIKDKMTLIGAGALAFTGAEGNLLSYDDNIDKELRLASDARHSIVVDQNSFDDGLITVDNFSTFQSTQDEVPTLEPTSEPTSVARVNTDEMESGVESSEVIFSEEMEAFEEMQNMTQEELSELVDSSYRVRDGDNNDQPMPLNRVSEVDTDNNGIMSATIHPIAVGRVFDASIGEYNVKVFNAILQTGSGEYYPTQLVLGTNNEDIGVERNGSNSYFGSNLSVQIRETLIPSVAEDMTPLTQYTVTIAIAPQGLLDSLNPESLNEEMRARVAMFDAFNEPNSQIVPNQSVRQLTNERPSIIGYVSHMILPLGENFQGQD